MRKSMQRVHHLRIIVASYDRRYSLLGWKILGSNLHSGGLEGYSSLNSIVSLLTGAQ